jgi:hypothetical protein
VRRSATEEVVPSRARHVQAFELTDEVAAFPARSHLPGIHEHFTGRLSQAQLRNVAAALEAITGPHLPH